MKIFNLCYHLTLVWLLVQYMDFSVFKCNISNLKGYLIVYSRVPSSWIRRSLFGIVILWATDFFPLWKKVSGVQILLAIKLLSRRMFIGPLNFNRSSFHFCRKKTSIVYSWNVKIFIFKRIENNQRFIYKDPTQFQCK